MATLAVSLHPVVNRADRLFCAMRDDLLDAQESVDWAVAQIPAFESELNGWIAANFVTFMEEVDPNSGEKAAIVEQKSPLPRKFNVATGCYINAFRSALDLLMSAIAARYGVRPSVDTHFPFRRSWFDFIDPKDGIEGIKWLVDPERSIIVSLKPDLGGNDFLWSLHHLDVTRKHARLLGVQVRPNGFSFGNLTITTEMRIIAPQPRGNSQTILGYVKEPAASQCDFNISADVVIQEGANILPVVPHLREWGATLTRIIKLFDGP